MELLLIGLFLWIIWEVIPRRERYENNSHPSINVPLHYIYAVDEWDKLRQQFDKKIEPVWAKYRFNEISSLDYELACYKVVEEIIGIENKRRGFRTLYQWGIRNAAVKMAKQGYAPGKAETALSLAELRRWEPEQWYISDYKLGRWNDCDISGKGFMQLYPDACALENAGVGKRDWKTGMWSRRTEPRLAGSYREYFGLCGSPEKVERYLEQRGYNGKTYVGERARGGGLCAAEQLKKYEFVSRK